MKKTKPKNTKTDESDSKLEMGSHLLISHFMYSLPVFL